MINDEYNLVIFVLEGTLIQEESIDNLVFETKSLKYQITVNTKVRDKILELAKRGDTKLVLLTKLAVSADTVSKIKEITKFIFREGWDKIKESAKKPGVPIDLIRRGLEIDINIDEISEKVIPQQNSDSAKIIVVVPSEKFSISGNQEKYKKIIYAATTDASLKEINQYLNPNDNADEVQDTSKKQKRWLVYSFSSEDEDKPQNQFKKATNCNSIITNFYSQPLTPASGTQDEPTRPGKKQKLKQTAEKELDQSSKESISDTSESGSFYTLYQPGLP